MEQKLDILSYNPGLKTEFHISCSYLPKIILDFAKLFILPDFLPQPFSHGYIRHIRDISQLCKFSNLLLLARAEAIIASTTDWLI